MIISASRRTDIPAFYSKWFMNRIEEGYFYSVNPFNHNQVRRVSLSPEDVDVFIFWSKNPAPMLDYLDRLKGLGYRYYFQYTLNSYPKYFEPNIPELDSRINTFKRICEKGGNVIWRYDPIILSNKTPVTYHIDRFKNISENLKGCTDRVIISFLDFYGKAEKRLKALSEKQGVRVMDITLLSHREELESLAKAIVSIAEANSMKVYSCSEAMDMRRFGIKHGSCIDVNYINENFGLNINYTKDKNQRKECGCAQSVDMGMYNTCTHFCTYCYANYSDNSILNNIKRHNDKSPALTGESKDSDIIKIMGDNCQISFKDI